MNVIEVRDITKRYSRSTANALDGVSFDVAAGELFCLLGPNGAGKTTALSILTTTLQPTSGSASIAGFDVVDQQSSVRRHIGIVFQGPSLDVNLTAEENIRMHAVLYGLYPWRPSARLMPRGYRHQVEQLAGTLGAESSLGRPVRTLSGGTRRKLEIVRALMHHPQVLFLDEPTSGLDPESRLSLWAYLAAARHENGLTVLFTTHYLGEAEEAGRLCVLADGGVLELGSPADIRAIYGQAATPFEEAYLRLVGTWAS